MNNLSAVKRRPPAATHPWKLANNKAARAAIKKKRVLRSGSGHLDRDGVRLGFNADTIEEAIMDMQRLAGVRREMRAERMVVA